MNFYDFEKAKYLIQENKDVTETASMYIAEDREWTEIVVYTSKDGYLSNLGIDYNLTIIEAIEQDDCRVAAIKGSVWGTPTIELRLKNGSKITQKITKGE